MCAAPAPPPRRAAAAYGLPSYGARARQVCISLLGTWSGRGVERWGPDSTLLQLLVSIQGLVLVQRPYYNEAGWVGSAVSHIWLCLTRRAGGRADGESGRAGGRAGRRGDEVGLGKPCAPSLASPCSQWNGMGWM